MKRPHDAMCRILVVTVAMGVAAHASSSCARVPQELISYPDWIFANGQVLTVDENFSIAEALAVKEGRILAVGATAAIERLTGPDTQRVDLAGKTMIPGIIDPHLHLQDSALNEFGADVAAKEPKFRDYRNTARVEGASVDEILQNIRQVVASRAPGSWVRVQLADGAKMGPLFYDRVRRRDLDAVAPHNPLVVQPYSIISIINSPVIEAIKAFYGFLPEEFERDATGQMTGRVDTVLVRSIVGDLLVDRPIESLPVAFKKGLEKYASYGVTTWSSAISPLSFLSVFREMDRRGDLVIRTALTQSVGIAVFPYASDFYRRLGDVTDMGTDRFWLWCQYSHQPNSDQPSGKVKVHVRRALLGRIIAGSNARRWWWIQPLTHADGLRRRRRVNHAAQDVDRERE